MATTGKDSAYGKEKRGTSPSYPRQTDTTQSKKSPNPSTRSSPDKKHASSSSSSAGKHIPNYLKPTVSSATDPSKQKQSSNDAIQKPTFNRRRSFDKPPSPSRILPKEGNLRSSSFSAKTTTSPKPHPDRLSRTPKDVGKHHSLYAKPLSGKKPISTIKKENNASSGLKTKAPSTGSSNMTNTAADISETEKPDVLQEDQALSATETEEETLHSEMPDETLILEDKEHADIVQFVPESEEDERLKEVSTISEDQDASLGVQMEGPEDKVHVDEISSDHHEIEDHSKDENNHNVKPEESSTGESKVEGEEKKREEDATENSNENTVDDEESQALKSKETEEAEPNLEEKAVPNHQGGQGKKDSPAYNDVIEETASKLREQRKNKVKALAGAFETVISLQEPKS